MVYLKELIGKKFKPLYNKAYEKDGKHTIKVEVDGKAEFLNLTKNEYEFYFKDGVDTRFEYEVYKNKKGYPAVKKVGSEGKIPSKSKTTISENVKKMMALQIINNFKAAAKEELIKKLKLDEESANDIVNRIDIRYKG